MWALHASNKIYDYGYTILAPWHFYQGRNARFLQEIGMLSTKCVNPAPQRLHRRGERAVRVRDAGEREPAALPRLEPGRRALLHVRPQVRRDARRAQPEVRVVAITKNVISEQDQVHPV